MKELAFVTIVLAACATPETPSFPTGPPAAQKLARLAGNGAVDCGTAINRTSADRVYECAAAALARRRPFFCRYSPPPIVSDAGTPILPGADLSPARIGGVWGGRRHSPARRPALSTPSIRNRSRSGPRF